MLLEVKENYFRKWGDAVERAKWFATNQGKPYLCRHIDKWVIVGELLSFGIIKVADENNRPAFSLLMYISCESLMPDHDEYEYAATRR